MADPFQFELVSPERLLMSEPVEQVVAHMREVAGQHLDPKYVELMVQNIDKALAINDRFPD